MVQKQVSHQIGATSFDTRRHICLAPSREQIQIQIQIEYNYTNQIQIQIQIEDKYKCIKGKQLDLIKCVYSLGFIHKSGLSPWHQP